MRESGKTPATAYGDSPADMAVPGDGATALGALSEFLSAARAQDLDRIVIVWGTRNGSAKATIAEADLEKRARAFMRYLAHDSYVVVSEVPGVGDARVFTVTLKRTGDRPTTQFTAVAGPSRWHIEKFDMVPLVR